MREKISGIKWKLFVYLLCFSLLLLIILILFQTVFLDKFYISIKQKQVEKEIAEVSQFVRDADWIGLENSVKVPGDIFVEIWSQEGLKLSTGNFMFGIHTQIRHDEIGSLFDELDKEGGALTRQYQYSENMGVRPIQNLASMQLVESTDGSTYLALVSSGLSPISATVDTLRVQLVYISVIMLLLSVGLALLISKKVSRPIVAISKTAEELGKGNYDLVFKGSGYREISQLADALTTSAKELSKTEALRQELIANVSHDLRTPLTLIAGYSEMIRDMPGEATADNMQVIIDETNRLSGLVSDLLDLSKLQAGVDKMTTEQFDISSLTKEIVGRVSRLCENDGFNIEYEATGEILVMGSAERISQVIYNFLLNAVSHTGADKKILVKLSADNKDARLEVIDSGEGITPEDLPHIWDRYYKVDKEHKREVSGSGLGLSIVRSILERHPDVDYGVLSQPGKGSTFWFSIPLI